MQAESNYVPSKVRGGGRIVDYDEIRVGPHSPSFTARAHIGPDQEEGAGPNRFRGRASSTQPLGEGGRQ
jgi:hypothetical protein